MLAIVVVHRCHCWTELLVASNPWQLAYCLVLRQLDLRRAFRVDPAQLFQVPCIKCGVPSAIGAHLQIFGRQPRAKALDCTFWGVSRNHLGQRFLMPGTRVFVIYDSVGSVVSLCSKILCVPCLCVYAMYVYMYVCNVTVWVLFSQSYRCGIMGMT